MREYFQGQFVKRVSCAGLSLMFGLFSLILLACGSRAPEQLLSQQDFLEKYSLLQDPEHVFISKTAKQILAAVKAEESFLLYIGFDSCQWCQALTPVINQLAKEQQLPEIWYWDLRPFRGDGKERKHSKEYLQILELLGLQVPQSELEKGIAGISRISVPLLAAINYGSLEAFETPPITLGQGQLMLDQRGEETSEPSAIRYQDGFFVGEEGQILGVYMWDSLVTGYQVPAEFRNRLEWLNRPEFLEPLKENLSSLLKISACGICSV